MNTETMNMYQEGASHDKQQTAETIASIGGHIAGAFLGVAIGVSLGGTLICFLPTVPITAAVGRGLGRLIVDKAMEKKRKLVVDDELMGDLRKFAELFRQDEEGNVSIDVKWKKFIKTVRYIQKDTAYCIKKNTEAFKNNHQAYVTLNRALTDALTLEDEHPIDRLSGKKRRDCIQDVFEAMTIFFKALDKKADELVKNDNKSVQECAMLDAIQRVDDAVFDAKNSVDDAIAAAKKKYENISEACSNPEALSDCEFMSDMKPYMA